MHDSTEIFTLDTLYIKDDEPRFLFDSIASIAVQKSTIAFASFTEIKGNQVGTGIYFSDNGLVGKY